MNWSQWAILALCALNAVLLLAISVTLRRMLVAPRIKSVRGADPVPVFLGEAPPKAEDKSVILLTPERDARILDGEEE